jgi:hypothetical protein
MYLRNRRINARQGRTNTRRGMRMSPIERRDDDETTTEQVREAIPRVGVNRSSEAGPSQGEVRTNGEAQNGAPQARSSQNTVTAGSNSQNTEPYVLPSYVEQELDLVCLRADLKRHETEALRKSEQILALERETRELRERLATAVETQQNNVVRINPNGMNEGSGGSGLQEQRDTWTQQTPRGPQISVLNSSQTDRGSLMTTTVPREVRTILNRRMNRSETGQRLEPNGWTGPPQGYPPQGYPPAHNRYTGRYGGPGDWNQYYDRRIPQRGRYFQERNPPGRGWRQESHYSRQELGASSERTGQNQGRWNCDEGQSGYGRNETRPNNFGKYAPLPLSEDIDLLERVRQTCATYRGQTTMEALSKREKEMLRQLNSDIQNVEGKAIPVSLTFAIFRWDLGEVIRWSPILTQEAQRSYGQVLRSSRAKTSAKVRTLTEHVLDTITLTGDDDDAWDTIASETTQSFHQWRNVVSLTTLPLVQRYWEAITPGIMMVIKRWLLTIDRDFASTKIWPTAKKAMDEMLWDYARHVARGFSHNSEKGEWNLLNFGLVAELTNKTNKLRLEELNQFYASRPESKRLKTGHPKPENKEKRKERPQLSHDETRTRTELEKRLGKKIPGFTIGKGCTTKIARHNDPHTKQWGCFFSCGGKVMAKELGLKNVELCKTPNCRRSHQAEKVYPQGIKCLLGECPPTCPARDENCK